MCARMKFGNTIYKPGDRFALEVDGKDAEVVWGGGTVPFARSENLERWLSAGWEKYAITPDGFAERHKWEGELVWEEHPKPIMVLMKRRGHAYEMAVVTRNANEQQRLKFGHPRVPYEL